MNLTNVRAETLRAFCRACFERLAVPSDAAAVVADNLVFANLCGVDSHGVIRLKVYCERLRQGGFNPRGQPRMVAETEATAVLDADNGLGAVAAVEAMDRALTKADRTGAGCVSVRRSNHFGACAFYALRAVERGMIGFAATNAGPTMAPTGGRERRLGNNAFAIAVPAGRHPPIVLDMATGAVAWGKIFVAQQTHQKIPSSWALDKHGRPTDDPDVAADGGLIQPFGGYKGYGLSLLIDLLTGVFAGGAFSVHVRTLYEQLDTPSEVAHLCGALRVGGFLPLAEFRARVDAMIDLLKACPLAPGVERIFVPGEIEHETQQRRRAEGIPLPATLLAELRALATELGVEAPW
jgi:LDH2 family malate/lactate/ureidoglycolate dehydrogenase